MPMDRRKLLLMFCASCAAGGAEAADVLQFGYDPSHSGNNAAESIVHAGNVSGLQQQYAVAFSGTDAPPVFLENVATAGGARDVLFFTTVYGIAAIDAASGKPIWVQSTGSFEYSTGTAPALDPNRQFVYGPGSDGRVHKLAVADGSEVNDGTWPIVSSAKPAIEKSSSPLAVAVTAQGAHYLYSVTASFNDADDYQGHLTAIDLATGTSAVFNAACSDLHEHFVAHGTAGVDDCASRKNGIWSRAGVAYDAYTNRIYIATGNGPFDANSGGHDWGDTVLALNPDGTGATSGPLDSYTPAEYSSLDILDIDLGSASPTVLPPVNGSAIPHLGAQLGKDGKLRLLDMDNLSRQHGTGHIGGELQIVSLLPGGVAALAIPQPAVWADAHGDGSVWLFASVDGTLAGLQLVVSNGQPLVEQRWLQTNLSVTASPMLANDVLYAMTEGHYSASIVAIDPRGGTVLWTSPPIDQCCHTQGPIVANGRIYIGSNTIVAMFAPSSAPPAQDRSHPALPGSKPARPAVRPPSPVTQRRPAVSSASARHHAIRKVLAVV